MKKLELLDRKTGMGTALVSYELAAAEEQPQPQGGAQPTSPPSGAQPTGGGTQPAGGSGNGSGSLPPIIFDPGRGMGPAFRAPRRYSNWQQIVEDIEHIAEQAKNQENRVAVEVNRNPSPDELHDVLARMPAELHMFVLIDP